jgi:hypothetical protein
VFVRSAGRSLQDRAGKATVNPLLALCWRLLDAVFSCPWCSRIFLHEALHDGPIPRHLDALLGLPCEGSGRLPPSVLDLPGHEEDPALEWPSRPQRAA